MKRIKLTQGQYALVDDADFERVNAFKWCVQWNSKTSSFYATRGDCSNGKRKAVYMHRYIMGNPDGLQIDHINHNTLDNRQANLRVCTNSQNHMNEKKQKNCSSEFKGITWYKATKKWLARIQIEGKRKHLGYYIDEKEAAIVYDAAATKHFGEFALLNFKGDKYGNADTQTYSV